MLQIYPAFWPLTTPRESVGLGMNKNYAPQLSPGLPPVPPTIAEYAARKPPILLGIGEAKRREWLRKQQMRVNQEAKNVRVWVAIFAVPIYTAFAILAAALISVFSWAFLAVTAPIAALFAGVSPIAILIVVGVYLIFGVSGRRR